MHFSTLTLASLLSLTPLALAVGSANVENGCDKPIYLWSVDSSVGDQQTIEPGQSYTEEYHRDQVTGGITLKVTRVENGLYNGSPQTNFALSLEGGRIWYDLSDVFGDAFKGEEVIVTPSDEECRTIEWKDGVPPEGSQVRDCQENSNVTLSLC
ncbi:hypothetical protein FQN54_008594 [Arachnomyces sp. PD_36]|nr:hypothetical protein FQN54_008594 [Arachnomyces sp. PD_36]